jgi:TrmH family RNA methyltransferase
LAFLVHGRGERIEKKSDLDILVAFYEVEIITTKKLSSTYRPYPTRWLTERQFRSICASKTPQGTMALVRLPSDLYSHRLPGHRGNKILLLEDIQDPGNIGTLIRTAGAFDFSGVILTNRCADPLSPKSVQSSAGSVLSVWMRRTSRYADLVESLQEQGFTLVVADLNGVHEPSVLTTCQKLLLCLGNEASGISPQLKDRADYRLKIPIVREKAESLNVGICGGILMYFSSLPHSLPNMLPGPIRLPRIKSLAGILRFPGD